jgi:hypothetical protein
MPDFWTVQHTLHDGTLLGTYAPENLQFTLNKKPPHTIQYELSLNRDGIFHDMVGPKRTNFLLYYGPTRIMGGLHTDFEVGILDEHCTIYGKDWFHYFELRQYPYDPRDGHQFDYVVGSSAVPYAYEVANVDINGILYTLANQILSRPNSLDISLAWINSHVMGISTAFSIALADTTYFAQMIDGLSEVDPGFMYEVTPQKSFRTYSPSKYTVGVDSDSSLADYIIDDSNSDGIIDLTFANHGPDATHLFGHGQGIGQNLIGSSLGAPVSEAAFYRVDNDVDVGTATPAQGRLKTQREFSRMLNPQHDVVLTVDPDKLANFWTTVECGKALWIDKDLIAHRIDSAQEVVQMDCTVSNEGDAQVTFGLRQIYAGTAGIPEG